MIGRRGQLIAVAALLAVLLVSSRADAQGPAPLQYLPALTGDYFPIRSRATKHDYHIYVRLPQDYAAYPDRTYPVVYLLDGDSLFPVVGGNHIFLTIDDKLPEVIVVGIAYGSFDKPINHRHIDFMPPGPGVKPGEAGIAAFNAFLGGELIPAVERRYRIDTTRRILFGQSRGGALVLYSAFAEPDLFWARIASNPSWTPGREIFFGTPAASKRTDLNLLIAIGSDEYADRRAGAAQWFAQWAGVKAPWAISRIDIPGGTHSADSANAYRAAMRRLFRTEPIR